MLKYIELKTGFNDNGPAWIGRVSQSKSGQSIYFNGKCFKKSAGCISGNHLDVETGDEYWISGIKKNGMDRHWAGSGKITIDAAVVDEYLRSTGASELDTKRFVVSHSIKKTDPAKFYEIENRKASD